MHQSFFRFLISLRDSSIIGILAGVASTIFLFSLQQVANIFLLTPHLLYLLPVAGFSISVIYQRWGEDSKLGNSLIIDEIHSEKKIIPTRMAPLIMLTTLMTHLFGGSAGREGTAVQMGASLADTLARLLRCDPARRKHFLIAGMSAGFGSAIGTPMAGAIFGMEVLRIGRLKPVAIIENVTAAYVAYGVSYLLQAPHSIYPPVEIYFSWMSIVYLIFASILFGLSARFFVFCTHKIEQTMTRLPFSKYSSAVMGGILLIFLFKFEGSGIYHGLGISTIQESFTKNASAEMPLLKILFTSLTLGSGFKGGEFTPLAFIGSTLGSSMAAYFPVSTSLFAAIGFAAVFGAASKTPLACAVMAAELFGLGILPYALFACLIAFHCSGMTGIYDHQKHDSTVLISRFLKWCKRKS